MRFTDVLIRLLLLVPAIAVAIPVHEMGHAAVAYLLGDRSVRYFGHFSLDPRRFLEPIGVLAVAVALVGWGRRVPVQSNRITTTGQKVLVELGGPAANLAVAIVLGFLFQALVRAGVPASYELGPGLLLAALCVIVLFAFQFLGRVNLLWYVMAPFYEPASLISLRTCDGYATGLSALFPCL